MNWYCYSWYPHKNQFIADLKVKKFSKSDNFCRSSAPFKKNQSLLGHPVVKRSEHPRLEEVVDHDYRALLVVNSFTWFGNFFAQQLPESNALNCQTSKLNHSLSRTHIQNFSPSELVYIWATKWEEKNLAINLFNFWPKMDAF